MTPFTRRLATAAACAALALPVLAQTTATSPAATPTDPVATQSANVGPAASRQAKSQIWKEKRAERHTARLAELKKTLAITPAQEPAWTTFSQAMQPRNKADRSERQAMEKLTTPERIDRMRTLRAERNAAMDARLDAT
ncbi:MAG: Spy/CpxP family protein refolding chaperone, partial [Giesbergeria sp.]